MIPPYLYSQKQIAKQPLLIPYEINLNALELEIVEKSLVYLNVLGFDAEITGSTLNIYSTPLELIDINFNEYFSLIFSDTVLKRETIPEIINERLMQKACKSAIKAGMELSKSEVDSLIRLLNGNINLKCPHGRPIAVKITKLEIDKWFKRVL